MPILNLTLENLRAICQNSASRYSLRTFRIIIHPNLDIRGLSALLTNTNCPAYIDLVFESRESIPINFLREIIAIFINPGCPKHLSINFKGIVFEQPENASHLLMEALSSGHCVKNLKLENLNSTPFNPIPAFAAILGAGRYPKNLQVGFIKTLNLDMRNARTAILNALGSHHITRPIARIQILNTDLSPEVEFNIPVMNRIREINHHLDTLQARMTRVLRRFWHRTPTPSVAVPAGATSVISSAPIAPILRGAQMVTPPTLIPADECSICLAELNYIVPIVVTRCGHFFHYDCLLAFQTADTIDIYSPQPLIQRVTGTPISISTNTCPMCRTILFPI